MIQVVRVSGTIRKAEEAAIRLARLSIKRAQRPAGGGKGAIALGVFEKSADLVMGGGTPIDDAGFGAGASFVDGIDDDDLDVDSDDEDD